MPSDPTRITIPEPMVLYGILFGLKDGKPGLWHIVNRDGTVRESFDTYDDAQRAWSKLNTELARSEANG